MGRTSWRVARGAIRRPEAALTDRRRRSAGQPIEVSSSCQRATNSPSEDRSLPPLVARAATWRAW